MGPSCHARRNGPAPRLAPLRTDAFALRCGVLGRVSFAGAIAGVCFVFGCRSVFGIEELAPSERAAEPTLPVADASGAGNAVDGTSQPVVDPPGHAVAIAAGLYHACALLEDGRVKCWGRNDLGQLGIGDTESRGDEASELGKALPSVDFGAGEYAVEIAAGTAHTCARLASGAVRCWGDNGYGRVSPATTPSLGSNQGDVANASLHFNLNSESAEALFVGSYASCVKTSSRVRCWGEVAGKMWKGEDVTLPTAPATSLSPGNNPACALSNRNQLYCWSSVNDACQLGECGLVNHTAPNNPPIPLPFVPSATYTAQRHACARSSAGEFVCWGANNYAQLGTGNTNPGQAPLAFRVPTGRAVIDAALGDYHTCVVFDDATVRCVGQNYTGALARTGQGVWGSQPEDVGEGLAACRIGVGRRVRKVAIGGQFTCVLLETGRVLCFGQNSYGQLGLGHTIQTGTAPWNLDGALQPIDLGDTELAAGPP